MGLWPPPVLCASFSGEEAKGFDHGNMARRNIFPIFLLLFTYGPIALAVNAQQRCEPLRPLTTSPEPNIFTEKQEVDLGDAVAEHLQRNFRVIDDTEVTGHLTRIGARIIKHLPPTALQFRFFFVDLPEANAFVLPGGRIYVSRKLIAFAQSEDELAGVISHEIGHLVARQGSIEMTRLLREVLGVTQVGDRRDIFDKYHQLVENAARKRKVLGADHGEKDQLVADQIGLYALASAGYDPQAMIRFWDRFAETKGQTGNFFSDLFGTTRPEVKRLREMIKGVAALPSACVEARQSAPKEEFQQWQASVVNYANKGHQESLHAVLSKTELSPPLLSEIRHLRFSPDGKYVLAQDDSQINVLSHEPFALLFRIEAPEANPAQFTPDSQNIIFYNSDLRIEVWSIADQKLRTAHEMVIRKECLQTLLSPDGKTLACLDSDLDLDIFDVTSDAQVFQKRSFYTPNFLDLIFLQLLNVLNEGDSDKATVDWINMSFSPDSHYFVAGQRGVAVTPLGTLASEVNAVAVDLNTHTPVALRGELKKLIGGGFTFVGPDRGIGINWQDLRKSALVSFPEGAVLDHQLPLGRAKLATPAHGKYLLLRPIEKFPVGVMDLATKTIFLASNQSAIDLYDDDFVSERVNGELGLYGVAKRDLKAKVVLPRASLGRLHAAAVSPDFKWLAISERTRGAVWDLTKGGRVFHVLGFRGGYFGDDGALYADFPKFGETERGIAKLDPGRRVTAAGPRIEETGARQYGPFVVLVKPARKDGGRTANVTMEVRDVRSLSPLWSRSFPREAPKIWIEPRAKTMVLSWPISASAAKTEIKADADLTERLTAIREKEGVYLLQVLDASTGQALGRLLIETGKGSFRISDVFAVKDWVIISDTQNRVLIYSLRTGERKGQMFGRRAEISEASSLLCVENEPSQLIIYDLTSMEKRDQFNFSTPIALTRFSSDGKRLLVLTSNQTAYLLDVSSLGS